MKVMPIPDKCLHWYKKVKKYQDYIWQENICSLLSGISDKLAMLSTTKQFFRGILNEIIKTWTSWKHSVRFCDHGASKEGLSLIRTCSKNCMSLGNCPSLSTAPDWWKSRVPYVFQVISPDNDSTSCQRHKFFHIFQINSSFVHKLLTHCPILSARLPDTYINSLPSLLFFAEAHAYFFLMIKKF